MRPLFDKRLVRVAIRRRRYVAHATATVGAIFALWLLLTSTGWVSPLFLPPPTDVLRALADLFVNHGLILDIGASIFRVMLGFCLAAMLAVPVGLLMGTLKGFEASVQPLTEFTRYLPVPALLPLCILWCGIGDFEKIVVIFLGTFFQLAVMAADDARTVPKEFVEIGYTFGLNRFETILKVILPGAAPRVFDDMRVCCGWAWSYLVVAEIVAANKGIGFVIIQSQRFLQTANVMAAIIVLGLLGLATDWAFRLSSRFFFPWEYQVGGERR